MDEYEGEKVQFMIFKFFFKRKKHIHNDAENSLK